MSAVDKRILQVLKAERRWMTFDELYTMSQCKCNWVDFALQLEQLVEQGYAQHILLRGMDVGLYRIAGRNVNGE